VLAVTRGATQIVSRRVTDDTQCIELAKMLAQCRHTNAAVCLELHCLNLNFHLNPALINVYTSCRFFYAFLSSIYEPVMERQSDRRARIIMWSITTAAY